MPGSDTGRWSFLQDMHSAASVTGLQMAHAPEEIYWAVDDVGTSGMMKWESCVTIYYQHQAFITLRI